MVGVKIVSVARMVRRQKVRRTIKVLGVAALVAVMLVASVSPALAAKARGGVLLQATTPCVEGAGRVAQNVPGAHLEVFEVGNPEERAPGCWVLLPPNANPGN
jgi:hypothetical protein